MYQSRLVLKSLNKSQQHAVAILTAIRLKTTAAANEPVKTSLYDFHLEHRGKLVNFGGYLLPVQYADLSITSSHLHTRENASMFDVSHMLQTEVKGKDATNFMESLCTADINGLQDGSGTLTVFTNVKGGILDDLIVTKIKGDYLYVVSNAARRGHDINLMITGLENFKEKNHKADVHLRFFDTTERALLALQGPKSAAVLQSMVPECKFDNVYFMQSIECTIAGIECRVTRCGYTGEDGFEISLAADKGPHLAAALLKQDAAVKLAGLGARDSLRLEAGLCLYGSDIDDSTTPIEAGLTWLVAKRRRLTADFPGANTILNQIKSGVDRKRVGILSQRGPPARSHTDLYVKNTKEYVKIGTTTSGSPSPSLRGFNIAMGYVQHDQLRPKYKIGADILLCVRDKFYAAHVAKMPFVPAKYYTPKK